MYASSSDGSVGREAEDGRVSTVSEVRDSFNVRDGRTIALFGMPHRRTPTREESAKGKSTRNNTKKSISVSVFEKSVCNYVKRLN